MSGRASPRDLRVGVLSDTHGLLRPETLDALAGSDAILHAGDVGHPSVLEGLARLAPVHAVRGNNDLGGWAETLPERATVRLAGVRVLLCHALSRRVEELRPGPGVGAIVSGHSHRPSIERRGDLLLLNPGSAGPRRFRLPVTVARLVIAGGDVEAEIVTLPV